MASIHFKTENLLPSNRFIKGCDYVPTESFSADYVDQVQESVDKLFKDICCEVKLNSVTQRQLVQKNKLNMRSVTKDKLVEWLETACYLLDTCCMPLLEQAVEDVEGSEVGQLQKEKIEDQKCIISLQQKLLDVNENGMIQMKKSVQDIVKEEFKTAQDTIQTEIKSYSSAVKSSCSEALSQKKIGTGCTKVSDREGRPE